MKYPILATAAWNENGHAYTMRVEGGLHYLKGNSAPHFSITADIREDHRDFMGGCCHDEIERRLPGRFPDLIALHLSDLNGVPLHFEANGWYTLAGILGGAGERYHAGNQDYRDTSPAALLQSFADHCRISTAEAQAIADEVRAEFGPENDSYAFGPHSPADYKRGRAKWATLGRAMLPRFKVEADACIANHNLVVYGDKWAAA